MKSSLHIMDIEDIHVTVPHPPTAFLAVLFREIMHDYITHHPVFIHQDHTTYVITLLESIPGANNLDLKTIYHCINEGVLFLLQLISRLEDLSEDDTKHIQLYPQLPHRSRVTLIVTGTRG